MRPNLTRANWTTIAAIAVGGLAIAEATRRYRARPVSRIERLAQNMHLDELPMSMPMAAGIGAAAALGFAGWLLSKKMREGPAHENTVEESIELDVPVSTAYNQWTQFEEFPKFMASVQSVEQTDDTHLHWRAMVGGKLKEWDAEITEQIPDKRIAWRSTSGAPNAGVVTFHKINENRTRVMLQMDYRPQTLVEKAGDAVGAVKLTTKGNLKRFKDLLERRGHETGAWRGTVQH
jgi:uncharacterized membrane protein